MSRKIYFYKHFEEPHCISPHRHTILQTLPQLTVRRGVVCHYATTALQPMTPTFLKVLSHLFTMKKVDNTRCCWGDTEQISHTPLMRVEICTTALLFADIYQRSMYHLLTEHFYFKVQEAVPPKCPPTAEWINCNSCNGKMRSTEKDGLPHTTWITSTNRTPRNSHKGQARSSKPGQLIWSDRSQDSSVSRGCL